MNKNTQKELEVTVICNGMTACHYHSMEEAEEWIQCHLVDDEYECLADMYHAGYHAGNDYYKHVQVYRGKNKGLVKQFYVEANEKENKYRRMFK